MKLPLAKAIAFYCFGKQKTGNLKTFLMMLDSFKTRDTDYL